jgi:hydrogenase expression/formation protein HypC
MCWAIPGKIISMKGGQALIDFNGLKKKANICLVSAKKGDYVMVHAGFAIGKVLKREVKEYNKLFTDE